MSVVREEQSIAGRCQRAQLSDHLDAKYGFERYSLPAERTGWLINMHPVITTMSSLPACPVWITGRPVE